MPELEHNGYFPLTEEHLDMYVPSRPGVYMLAVKLVNGVHQTFFTSQSDNLYRSLRRILADENEHLSDDARSLMGRFKPYFTFFVIPLPDQRRDVEKMLSNTMDPVLKLRILEEN